MLRGRLGPSPGAQPEPTAPSQTPGLEGATSCLPPAPSRSALQSISAWCHPRLPPHTDNRGPGAPPSTMWREPGGGPWRPLHLPPPLSVLAPLRAPRGTHGCPLATSAARCELASTPHRAAGGPPAAAGGVPGDGRPGPRPPRTGVPPPAPFTVTGRDGDGAGDLSEPPRALAPVPALPRRSPLSLTTPAPAPEPGLGTHPHPAPDPAAVPQHLQLPDK